MTGNRSHVTKYKPPRTTNGASTATKLRRPAAIDIQPKMTNIPATTNACRNGLPFGESKPCQTSWVNAICMLKIVSATASVYTIRSRAATLPLNGKLSASSNITVPTARPGVSPTRSLPDSSRDKKSSQLIGSKCTSGLGVEYLTDQNVGNSNGIDKPIPPPTATMHRNAPDTR